MGFGRGKKRESWSSRPLSMLLSDNVKLFNKKGKAAVEKGAQDQSRRTIAGGYTQTPKREEGGQEVASLTRTSTRATNVSRDASLGRPSMEPTVTQDVNEAPQASTSSNASDTAPAPQKVAETPFLTLNLGDTPDLLLDLPDQYSSLNGPKTEEPRSASTDDSPLTRTESSFPSQRVSDSPRTSEGDLPSSDEEPRQTNTDKAIDNAPPVAEMAEIDLNQMPWAVHARDTPMLGDAHLGDQEQEVEESNASMEIAPELAYEQGSEVGSPNIQASNRQDSTFSSDTQPSVLTTPDEFVVETNRKIILNRGVYIFDPTNQQDLVHTTLSADELFNPFDLE